MTRLLRPVEPAEPTGPPRSSRPLPRWVLPAVVLIGLLAVAGSILFAVIYAQTARTTQTLADQVASACAAGGDAARELVAQGACAKAAQVQSVPLRGPTGASGVPGAPGRGVAATAIVGGDLVVTYTDGTRVDVGPVVGPAGQAGTNGVPGATGATGADGAPGRGITSAQVVDGHLIITYSDGTTQDAGQVVAPTATPEPTQQPAPTTAAAPPAATDVPAPTTEPAPAGPGI